jgi:LAS superfamily LD-carboxypeptidase LdcB
MGSRRDLLVPAARDALEALQAILAETGYPSWVTSTLRSYAEQDRLYREWRAGKRKYPVAPPGHSRHETGTAFDIGSSARGLAVAGAIAPYLGLRWGGTFTKRDPVHFELTGQP